MKKVILALAIVAGLTGTSHAQEPVKKGKTEKADKTKLTPEERAKKSTNRAEKELGLNADQKAKWEAATLERINANQPLREKMKGSTTPDERKTLHSQAKANMEKFDANVNGFLTAEQQEAWTKMKEKRKKGGHKKGAGKDPGTEIEDHD